MSKEIRQIETVVHAVLGKPVSWAIYLWWLILCRTVICIRCLWSKGMRRIATKKVA